MQNTLELAGLVSAAAQATQHLFLASLYFPSSSSASVEEGIFQKLPPDSVAIMWPLSGTATERIPAGASPNTCWSLRCSSFIDKCGKDGDQKNQRCILDLWKFLASSVSTQRTRPIK